MPVVAALAANGGLTGCSNANETRQRTKESGFRTTDAGAKQVWMGLLDWLKGRGAPLEDSRLRGWRHAWGRIAATPHVLHDQIEQLAVELDSFRLPDDEIEIEREMLDALREREALRASVQLSGLPLVDTGHRVVRGEPCHYSAPASMPEEPGQPSGRLLLTSGRAIFVGGANGMVTAWHMISETTHTDRDVVLIRNGRDQVYTFRCNSYGDALRATFIACELLSARRRPRSLEPIS